MPSLPPPPPGEQASAPLSNPQLWRRIIMFDGRAPHAYDANAHRVPLIIMAIVVAALAISSFLVVFLLPRDYPMLRVAGLSVSNFTVAAPAGSTWKAAIFVEKPDTQGKFLFSEVKFFLYYHWDSAQPLAVGSAEPFMLQAAPDRTVIKAKMTMERLEVEEATAAVEDMDQERRSMGTVAVGLGLRMRGRYVIGPWWKKGYGHIEAYCDNLKVAFANSTVEGSLVTGGYLVTGDDPLSKNLPACTYNDDPSPYPA